MTVEQGRDAEKGVVAWLTASNQQKAKCAGSRGPQRKTAKDKGREIASELNSIGPPHKAHKARDQAAWQD